MKRRAVIQSINVLSLFDGMSCGRVALERAGIPVNKYFASEIDKYAIKIAQKNCPKTIQIGNVEDVKGSDLPKIDLLIGGSPCQGFSFAGKQLNFDDPRSKLFFEYVRLWKECEPKYFLLENVKMKKESEAVITEYLGVEPIAINSALVSGQNRRRLYWTNIPGIEQPEDRGILLRDVLDKDYDPALTHTSKAVAYMDRVGSTGRSKWSYLFHSDAAKDKSVCMVANLFKGVPNNVLIDDGVVRKFSPVECERLQTLPEGYTEGVSPTQRYKMLGNGWTVEVISHILKEMK